MSDWAVCHGSCLMMDYRTNTGLREDLMEMGRMFPDIAMPFVIGSSTVSSVFTCLKFVLSGVSANFTPLTGIRISRDVRLGSPSSLKPLVRLVSNIAGDEATGRELLTHLALHLLYLYNKVSLYSRCPDHCITGSVVVPENDFWLSLARTFMCPLHPPS